MTTVPPAAGLYLDRRRDQPGCRVADYPLEAGGGRGAAGGRRQGEHQQTIVVRRVGQAILEELARAVWAHPEWL